MGHQVSGPIFSYSAGTVMTYSIFLKATRTGHVVRMRPIETNSWGENLATDCDLRSETTSVYGGNGNVYDSGVEPVGNGWYRCWITGLLSTTATNATIEIFIIDSIGQNSYTQPGSGRALYAWGAQAEAQPFLTNYIPTGNASANRVGDVVTVNNFGSWFNESAWTTVVEFSRRFYPSQRNWPLFAIDRSSSGLADSFRVEYASGTQTYQGLSTSGNTARSTAGGPAGQNRAGESYQIGLVHAGGGVLQLAQNGFLSGLTPSAVSPTALDRMTIGGSSSTGFGGHLRSVRFARRAFSGSELQAATTDRPITVSCNQVNRFVHENAGTITLKATLSRIAPSNVTVPFTLGGSGQSGVDYDVSAAAIVIPAGQMVGTKTVTLRRNPVTSDRTVTFTMNGPTGAAAASPSMATLTILNAD